MRKLTDHIGPGAIDAGIEIEVTDEPGAGGANHCYVVRRKSDGTQLGVIQFQNGGVVEAGGINGLTQEVLLSIVIDRLRSFQKGPFSCRENAIALTKCEEARHWLHARTFSRLERGVEGVSTE